MRWGTRQPLPLPIAFVSFVAVLAVLLAAVFALPAAAHADEPAEGDNAVNTQQLPDSSFIYARPSSTSAAPMPITTIRPCR